MTELRRSPARANALRQLLCAFIAAAVACAETEPRPPDQPAQGPGGAGAAHAAMTAHFYGRGATAYWLFEPAAPKPTHAPLIVFNHGWSAMDPHGYGAWIEHLVRRGNIVVYPVYQDSLRTAVNDFTPNAAAAITAAIRELQTGLEHVRPDLAKFALAGHSMGGVISANLAASAAQYQLPTARAVLCVEPGKTWNHSDRIAVQLADLSKIPKNTLLLCVTGDRDTLARDIDAKRIFRESTAIPTTDKNYVTLQSDDHGQPALVANHFAPAAPGGDFGLGGTPSVDETTGPLRRFLQERAQHRATQPATSDPDEANVATTGRGLDALDFYGTWKLLDGLTDAAFFDRNREFALGNTPQQRFMGTWSDGVPVRELIVTIEP